MDIHLSDEPDMINCRRSVNGVFLMKSMHLDLIDSCPIPKSLHTLIIKVPLRIGIFMWFVYMNVILTSITWQSKDGRIVNDVVFVIRINYQFI